MLKQLFFEPKPAFALAQLRILIYSIFAYKLLSRDFSIFAVSPQVLLEYYPHEQYAFKDGLAFFGTKSIVDLASFHWIHWFLKTPNGIGLEVLQMLAFLLCVLNVFFGGGPKRIFAISAYCLISYLWGYCWRSGADIDAVFLGMQLLLIFCFFKERESLILCKNSVSPFYESKENGACYSLCLLIVCSYYFYAGINKLVDISFLDWFRYNLSYEVRISKLMFEYGYFYSHLDLPSFLSNPVLTKYLFVPATYFAELTSPLMFFYRRLIPAYLFFFIVFHVMTWSVSILFFGNILVLLAFVPLHKRHPA